jgi:uncharacterized NAD-dependent epimerase/dehydratase family protein
MSRLNDDELLDAAEKALNAGRSINEVNTMVNLSTAQSLLVIARNTRQISEDLLNIREVLSDYVYKQD